MGELLVILFDLVAALAVCAIAYMLYRKFVAPPQAQDRTKEIAYEEGFSDAVKYFGLKKLYDDDPELKQRMNQVFSEVGVSHRLSDLLEGQKQTTERSGKRLG